MVQVALLAAAVAVLIPGIQGLRGVPDSNGKPTSKAVAVVCLVLAVALIGFALFGIQYLFPPVR